MGLMTLKTLRCCSKAASLEQSSAVRDIYPLTPPPPDYICLLGELLPINLTRWHEAMVATVVVTVVVYVL